jgi:hypothetical protein
LLGPGRFFGFDSLMEFIAFVIAIAVAYQALKGYKLSKERTLLYLNVSFGLLAVGLFIDAFANAIVLIPRFHRDLLFLTGFGYTLNFVAQVLAYGILVVAYVQQARTAGNTAVMATLPLVFFEHNAVTELILIFLVAFIATQTAMNYSVSKTTNALLVLGAFASLAISHILFLLYTMFPIFFPFAHIAQLFGFLLLLAMLLRVNQAQ